MQTLLTEKFGEKNCDVLTAPLLNSEVLSALQVLQTTCLYHDTGQYMCKNVNILKKLYEVSTIKNKQLKCIKDFLKLLLEMFLM